MGPGCLAQDMTFYKLCGVSYCFRARVSHSDSNGLRGVQADKGMHECAVVLAGIALGKQMQGEGSAVLTNRMTDKSQMQGSQWGFSVGAVRSLDGPLLREPGFAPRTLRHERWMACTPGGGSRAGSANRDRRAGTAGGR